MKTLSLRRILASAGLVGGIFVLDQWTKTIFSSWTPNPIIPNILSFTTHENRGLLANFPVPIFLIIAVTSIASIILGYLLIKETTNSERFLKLIALSLLLGGALGNLIDRIRFGYVFDWILLFNRSIINIADIAVTLGIILWLAGERTTKK